MSSHTKILEQYLPKDICNYIILDYLQPHPLHIQIHRHDLFYEMDYKFDQIFSSKIASVNKELQEFLTFLIA